MNGRLERPWGGNGGCGHPPFQAPRPEAVGLRYLEEKSLEIVRELGMGESAVKMRVRRGVDPPAGLDERCLDGVEAAIAAQDLAESGASVFVVEFLRPVLDLWVHLLGFDERGERSE